jgi:GT2 family glycosyltransferase
MRQEPTSSPSATALEFYIDSARITSSFELSGWAFNAAHPIKQIAAILSIENYAQQIIASFPIARPDVAEAKADPRGLLSGFSVDGLPALPAAEISLDLLYLDETTERIPLGSVRELIRRFPWSHSDRLSSTRYPRLAIPEIIERFDREAAVPQRLSRPVDIIIPVYRGREFIADFFASLFSSEIENAAITIVDDGNDDSVVAEYLQSDLLQRPDVKIIRKHQNEGFVLAVCTAFDNRVYQNDVVLLNTDTVLPRRWLPRLVGPLQANRQIASTTPFTNSGTICSFPVIYQDNPPFLDMPTADIDSVFSRFDAKDLILELPTGVGFCMGLSAEAISKVGFLDRVAFGRGFGEENDWCLRAEAANFKNTIVPNLYVHHKRGGSYSAAQKRDLLARNLAILDTRYQGYRTSLRDYQDANPLFEFRTLTAALAACQRYKFSPSIWQNGLFSEGGPGSLEWIFNLDPVSICYDIEAVGRGPAFGVRIGSRVTSYKLDAPLAIEQFHRVFDAHIR